MAEGTQSDKAVQVLGIDVGGSGIKGAPVDIRSGQLVGERYRIPTPQASMPEAVGGAVAEVIEHFEWHGPVGITLPAPIRNGVVLFIANLDQAWNGVNAQALFAERTGCPVMILNDADAAGVAEMQYGAGRGQPGTVIMLTIGTGIGSAIFVDGRLIPNTEFGHLQIRGKDAETRASDRTRQKKQLSWRKWSMRMNELLEQLGILFSPDLFIIGGGVSKRFDQFAPYLLAQAPVVRAQLLNDAGIVGAALAASTLIQA
jgi:polyphosphate glucokinase